MNFWSRFFGISDSGERDSVLHINTTIKDPLSFQVLMERPLQFQSSAFTDAIRPAINPCGTPVARSIRNYATRGA